MYSQHALLKYMFDMASRAQEHENERSGWQKERESLEQQVVATRAEWQGKLEKALAEAHHHRQATAQTAGLADAAQQQADRLRDSLK